MLKNLEQSENSERNHLIVKSPYGNFLGITYQINNSKPEFILEYSEKNIGNTSLPALHGGVIGGFMEHVAIVGAAEQLQLPSFPKVINIHIDYLLSGRPKPVFGECNVVKRGKRIVYVQVECWQEAREKLVAFARLQLKVTRMSS